MTQFNFGESVLETSPERDRFATLRRKYMDLGEKHQQRFFAKYPTIKSADNLFEILPDFFKKILDDTAEMVAGDLAENHIFDISKQILRANIEVRAEAVADQFNLIQDRYLTIISNAAELEEQRQQARDNRPQIIGGGFGVQGAIQGIALAAIANTAIGWTYDLANASKRAASQRGDDQKKHQLLTDPTTKNGIGSFLIHIALQGAELGGRLIIIDPYAS